MAMASEGFSIRGYVAKMRSVNFNKCWPFHGGDGGGLGSRTLPEISVRKFRLWSDEVKIIREGEQEGERVDKPISLKGKPLQRTPKKRSIVEIFAVAPPIDEEEEEVKVRRKGKGKMTNKRKRRRRLKTQICAAKKEQINKSTSSHILHTLQGSTSRLLSGKNRKKPVDSGMKLYKKNLPMNSKLKLLQSSKVISKKKNPGKILQVHKILKKPTSTKIAGSKRDTRGGNLVNSCRESKKRVALSSKCDKLGCIKSCSQIDIPQLRSLCKIFSDVLAASSTLDNTSKEDNILATANDTNVDRNIVEKNNGTSSDKKQTSESHGDVMPPTLSVSVDQHPSIQGSNDVDRFVTGTTTSSSSDRHLDDEHLILNSSHGKGSHFDTQVKESSLKTSGLLSFIRNSSPPRSISCSVLSVEENVMQPLPPVEALNKEFHPLCYLPSKYLMSSSEGSRLVPISEPICKDKSIREGFVGLPLNSQGELIDLPLGAKFGFGEINRRQNAMHCSIYNHPVPDSAEPQQSANQLKTMKEKILGAAVDQNGRSSWFQEHYLNCNRPVTSGNSFTNPRSFENFGVQSNGCLCDRKQIFLHGPNMTQASYYGCRDDNRTENYIDRVNFAAERNANHVSHPNIQQTVRLLGTNVTVARNNKGCQSYDDERLWTNKEVVSANYPSMIVCDKQLQQPCMQQWRQQQVAHQSSMNSRNSLFHPLDVSSNIYPVPTIAPMVGIPQFDYRPQWMSQNGTTSMLTCIPGTTSVNMGRRSAMNVSNHPRGFQHALLSSIHCKRSQGIAHGTTSTFRPPFLQQEIRGFIQPSPTRLPPDLPPWMLNAKQQKKSQESSCSCHSNPAPHTDICFPTCTATSSAVQSSLIPAGVTTKSHSQVHNFCKSKNVNREGMNFNFTYLRSLDSDGKTGKRSATKDDAFMKQAKKPFVRMQEGTSACRGQGEQMNTSESLAKNTTSPKNSEVVNEKEKLKTLPPSSSLKVDGGSGSGPIKLSAGATHILKPNPDTDKGNSGPVHSTMTFSMGNTSSKVLVPQIKAAEIYRF